MISGGSTLNTKRIKYSLFLGILGLFMLPYPLAVSDDSAEMVFGFASSLMEQGDYYRAISEFKRFLYLFPENDKSLVAKFRIGECYELGERFDKAIEIFREIAYNYEKSPLGEEAYYKVGLVLLSAGRFRLARDELFSFTEDYPSSDNYVKALALVGGISVYLDEEEIAEEMWKEEKIPESDREHLLKYLQDYRQDSKKSPTVAAILSLIVPGAGHFYTGEIADGIIAFILNSLFIGAMVESFLRKNVIAGAIFGLFELNWYAGTVYGAVTNAYRYNLQKRENFIEKLIKAYNIKVKIHSPLKPKS